MPTELEKKQRKRELDAAYRLANAEKIANRRKAYRSLNKEKIRAGQKRCYAAKRDEYNARVLAWKLANEDRSRGHASKKYWRDPEKSRARSRASSLKYREIRKTNPQWLLRRRISARMLRSLKSAGLGHKPRRWEAIVGYSLADLKAHLELRFLPGMSWENMGKWHVDHIKPVSSFRFVSVDDPEFVACWALSNLRPLWAADNLRKYNKYALAA